MKKGHLLTGIYILILIFLFTSYTFAARKGKEKIIIVGDKVKTRLISTKNGKKYYITELTGNPKIKFGERNLRAKKIIIRGYDSEIAEGIGNVIINDKKSKSVIRSEKAVYYKHKEMVEILGNPSLVTKRENDNSIVQLKAEKMVYDIENDIANAYRGVFLKNNDTRIQSERLIFERKEKKLIFFENPVMYRGEDILKGSEIVYYTDKKALLLNGNAYAVTFNNEKDSKEGKIIKKKVITKGDRIEHYDAEEKLTIITGNAKIERDDAIFKGDRIEIIGKESDEMTGNNVMIEYKEENMEAYGEYFKYNNKDKYSTLWGGSHIIIEDEDAYKENSKIYGSFMEYYHNIDELYISGDVKVLHDSEIIKGDMARYRREVKNMYITGNSRIEKGDSVIYSDSIIYNTKSRNTMLNGKIKGFVSDREGF